MNKYRRANGILVFAGAMAIFAVALTAYWMPF